MATWFERELREQPDVLAGLVASGREAAEAAAQELRRRRPAFVVIAARGSSDNAARYGQYLFGIRNGLLAALATPSVFTQYRATPALGAALVIGISQSGRSPDVGAVLREARHQGAITLALTNSPASPLAEAAELSLPLRAGVERAVAATKTYTAELAGLAMLSAALAGDGAAWQELGRLPEQVAQALDLAAPCLDEARRFADSSRLVVVGRGYHLSTALEISLKVKETSGVMADGYSSADFLHGPKALLDPGLPVLAVAAGRGFQDLDAVMELARRAASPLIAISDQEAVLARADVAVPLPPGTPEWLSPVVGVVPGQLWALGLSLARGVDPDAPRGLSKVTETL